jgi:two-component sensor histidine kinase
MLAKILYQRLLLGTVAIVVLCFASSFTNSWSDTLPARLLQQLATAADDEQRMQLSLQLGAFFINKPGETPDDIREAKFYADKALNLSRKIRSAKGEQASCVLYSQIYREKREEENGKMWATRAVTLATARADLSGQIDACLEMANYYSVESDTGLNKKAAYYAEAVKQLRKVDPGSIRLADALKFLGDLHNLQGAHAEAIAALKEALSIYQARGYEELQDIYNLIGHVYNLMEDTQQALHYNLLAVKTLESFKDSSATACACYNRLGMLYINLSEPVPARINLEKALVLAKRNNDNSALAFISSNLSSVYVRLGTADKAVKIVKEALAKCPPDMVMPRLSLTARIIDAYVELQQYGPAQAYYETVAGFIEDGEKTDNITQNTRIAVIRLFTATRQFDRLEPLLQACLSTAQQTRNIKFFAATEQLYYKADSARGKFFSALQHHELYKGYNDSLVRRNHAKQLMQMQVQYETARKDTELVQQSRSIYMLKQQNELQQSMLRSQRNVRNLSFTGAGLFALLLLVGYSRYRVKQSANRDLQEKQAEVNLQNAHLRDLLTEREWLLKEVHHRVKNNLQIVISLLNSQSIYLTDPKTLNVLQESQNRIFSISLIHQKLYQDENVSGISMRTYIHELTTHLTNTFGTAGRIRFQVQTDDLLLDVAQAVPLGLIMNEAITNAMKYAFPGHQKGTVSIVFREDSDGWLTLELADNGIGLPAGVSIDHSPTLGMSLIRGLSEQLGADLELIGPPGLSIKLKWQKSKLLKSLPRQS